MRACRYTKQEDMIDAITGRTPMPWEDPENKDANLRKLRMLKRSLTKCLSREPRDRPSAAQLLQSWEALFDSFGGEQTVMDEGPVAPSGAGAGAGAGTAGGTASGPPSTVAE